MVHNASTRDMVTRFAPSPTGRLHVGHAWSAVQAHDLARALAGGRFLLRIEDIDAGRCRPEHVEGIYEDLRWLGLGWDGEPVVQSARAPAHRAALDVLIGLGLAYRCFCTRAEIAAQIAASASAPHGADGPVYPGTCRSLSVEAAERRAQAGEPHAWRLDMEAAMARAGPLTWRDMDGGAYPADPRPAGDIVLARKDAAGSYHLCAVADDAAMGVTHIVRGADLLAATSVHRLLQALLGLPAPAYRHHRLLAGPDGRRLAKRDGGSTLAALRAQGADPARLLDDLRSSRFPVGIALL